MRSPRKYFNSSPETFHLAVILYVRYPLSLRNVGDLLAERGVDVCQETVRPWWNRLGPLFAGEIRKRRLWMRRDAQLAAIGRARTWVRELVEGKADSFEGIAQRERKGERHIRLLAPLALISPRIVAAIINGTAPAGLTVTGLARALPLAWAAQERRIGLN